MCYLLTLRLCVYYDIINIFQQFQIKFVFTALDSYSLYISIMNWSFSNPAGQIRAQGAESGLPNVQMSSLQYTMGPGVTSCCQHCFQIVTRSLSSRILDTFPSRRSRFYIKRNLLIYYFRENSHCPF